MKHTTWCSRVAAVLFALTLSLFSAFFGYMLCNERVSVFHLEQTHGYTTLTGFESQLVYDDAAPAGVVKVYRGILDPELSSEGCLCFNIAHHSIEVYFDDVLVYSLTGAESNRIGKNVSSNWCSVHVGQTHAGKTATVRLTPMFEAAISKEPRFLLGSHYAIAMDVVTGELPLLILSALCILLGLFLGLGYPCISALRCIPATAGSSAWAFSPGPSACGKSPICALCPCFSRSTPWPWDTSASAPCF